MSRTRKALLILLGIAIVMATIHFTINGLPALSDLNPHGH
jgi:hypothetical protein